MSFLLHAKHSPFSCESNLSKALLSVPFQPNHLPTYDGNGSENMEKASEAVVCPGLHCMTGLLLQEV